MSTGEAVPTSRVSAPVVRRLAPVLVALGEFVDGYDLLVMSVALLFLTPAFHLTTADKGVVGAASYVGAGLGALVFGDLTDRFGRRLIFIFNLLFFVVAAIATAFVTNVPELVIARLVIGLGVGMDIPTSSSYLAEIAPSSRRGRFAGSLPNALWLAGASVSALIALGLKHDPSAWRWLFGLAAVPAFLVLLARQLLPESPRWLQVKGRTAEAEAIYAQLGLEPPSAQASIQERRGYRDLFRKQYRTRALAVGGFFAFNGLGGAVSTIAGPLFLVAAGLSKSESMQFSLYGFLVGLGAVLIGSTLIDRVNRRVLGILTCLGALVTCQVLAFAGKSDHGLIFVTWLLFSAFTWIGPGTLAWVWSAELFPTALRGIGTGFSQAVARWAIAITAGIGPAVLATMSLHAVSLFSLSYLVCAILLGAFAFFATTGTTTLEQAAAEPGATATTGSEAGSGSPATTGRHA
jgi:MFS transporter, putative metabolite transport protein